MSQKEQNQDLQARADAILAAREQAAALLQQFTSAQNLQRAIWGGGSAALVSAVLWATITVLLNVQFSLMAIGVGLLVGTTVRLLGKGITPRFGYVGGAWALTGCLLGNLFAVYGLVAAEEQLSVWFVLSTMGGGDVINMMKLWFGWIDLVFYGTALYGGYTLSFRDIEKDMVVS